MTKSTYIDCETTGLEPTKHQAWEVAWWHDEEPEPRRLYLPHTLQHADPAALRISRYHERDGARGLELESARARTVRVLVDELQGRQLVGSNPSFDAAFLARFIGAPVWHHALVDIAQAGRWVFGWDHHRGLAGYATHLAELGYEIPAPDHSAIGDVRTTRAVHEALLRERDRRQAAWDDH